MWYQIFTLFKIFNYVYVFACVNVHDCGCWRKALDALELELQPLWANMSARNHTQLLWKSSRCS